MMRRKEFAALGSLLCSVCTTAWAQPADAAPEAAVLDTIAVDPGDAEVAPAAAEPQATASGIEEVLVTAQKRVENIADVPISIQAFSGKDLAARGIDNTRQLDRVVPGLQFDAIASFPLVFIRGLGSDNFVPSADPSIATYIDGIYIPNGAGTLQSLADIERVEVLKGPQGTLFGRNATGGAISVVTQEPGDSFGGSFGGQVGNFDARSAKASLSGPVTSWFSAGISGETSRKDAYYSNLNYEVPRDKLDAVRVKAVFRPTEKLSLTLNGYRSDQGGLFYMIYKNVRPSLLGTLTGMLPQEDNYVGESDYPGFTKARQEIASAIVSWQLPGFDLKLLGSDQHHLTSGALDFDGSPSPVAALSTERVFTDLQTGELQLLSNDDSWLSDRLTWVAGLYYLRSSAGFDPAVVRLAPGLVSGLLALPRQPLLTQLGDNLEDLFNAFGLSATPLGDGGLSLIGRGTLDTRSYSAYVQGTYRFADWIDLTLGGRVQKEKRFLTEAQTDLSDFSGNGSVTLLPFDLQSARASNFAPKAVLSLRPSKEALVYLSYSVAYKSGTYNVVNTYLPPNYLVPEKVYSFEAGTKLALADGALRLDAALFDSNIRNLQSGFTSLLSGGIVQFFSVPKARSRGAELNVSWLPLRNWNPGLALSANGAYIDAIYQDFPDGPGYREASGIYSGTLDHSGNRMTHTPKWSGNIGLAQRINLGKGVVEIAAEDYYCGKTYASAQNVDPRTAYSVLNARVGYRYTPWNLSLTLFSQNLLDRRYHTLVGSTDFGLEKTLAPPREYGLRLGWEF